jgi:NRPS condensation-like uncharacterized protein
MLFDQAGKPAILRPLGGIEKLFWLISQNRQTHFAITAEVAGSSQVAQWQEALDRICGQLPVIWSRIVPDSRGAPLFEVVPRGPIPLQVVEYAGSDWATHVAAEIERPFDPSEAPLLRATLLHGDDRSVIILCAHHTIADGLSLSFLMRDLLRTLGGETVVLSPVTASLEQMVASRTEPAGTLTPPPEAPPAGRDAPYRLLDGSLPHVESLRFSREKTERLRAWARAERTTVHGALSAAATFAASVRMPRRSDPPLRVHSPIDVRGRLLGGSEGLGVFVSAAIVELGDGLGDFRRRARFFSDSLAPLKASELLAGMVGMMRDQVAGITTVDQAQAFLAQQAGADILLSNLGAVDFPDRYGPFTLEALWGPSVTMGFAFAQTIGAITLGGQLHLLHTSYEPARGLLAETSSILDAVLQDSLGYV